MTSLINHAHESMEDRYDAIESHAKTGRHSSFAGKSTAEIVAEAQELLTYFQSIGQPSDGVYQIYFLDGYSEYLEESARWMEKNPGTALPWKVVSKLALAFQMSEDCFKEAVKAAQAHGS